MEIKEEIDNSDIHIMIFCENGKITNYLRGNKAEIILLLDLLKLKLLQENKLEELDDGESMEDI